MNQRPIKFRALTHEGQIIREVGKIEFFTDGGIIVNDEIPVKQLIEFTGLHDKNGKEIYGGDVLAKQKATAGYKTNGRRYKTVQWKTTGFNVRRSQIWEVIGNIYENPDLLKEPQKE